MEENLIIRKSNETAAAFIMALVIMFILVSLGTAFVVIARSRTDIVSNQRDALQAFYIAEAGSEAALENIFADSVWRAGFTNFPFAGGSYNVSLTGGLGEVVEITSCGTFGQASRTIRTEVLVINPGNIGQLLGTVGTGAGNANFSGSTGKISGIVLLKGNFIKGGMDIDNARIIQGFAQLPEITVDFAAYEAIATYVKPADFTFQSGQTYAGVYYIKGNAIIQSDVTINGTVVAEGPVGFVNVDNVTIAAEGGVPVQGYPAIITGSGIAGRLTNSSITGLVYASEFLWLANCINVTFTGGLILGGDILTMSCRDLKILYGLDMQPPYFNYPVNDEQQESTIEVISWKAYPGSN